jgi:hypothetical protein
MESGGSRRQSAGLTKRKRIEAARRGKRAIRRKAQFLHGVSRDVDPTGISVKLSAQYPGRSDDLPCTTGIERCWEESSQVSRGQPLPPMPIKRPYVTGKQTAL